MNKIHELSPLFVVFALTFILQMGVSCAPKPAIKEEVAKESVASVGGVSSEGSWQDKWNRLLGVAKREGKLFFAIASSREETLQFQEAIQKKLQIETAVMTDKSAAMNAKILAERRAGLYLWDILIGGASPMLTTLKPAGVTHAFENYLILPEVIDKKNWFEGKLHWLDEPDNTILNFGGGPSLSILINKEMVKEGELSSYMDLLNPRWKGKIMFRDPTVAGKGQNWFIVVGTKIMDMDYMRKLAQQNLTFTRNELLLAEWVARGKFPISIASGESEVKKFQNEGAPIDYIIPKEGTYLSTGGGNMVFFDKPANPNAAKAFVNWFLSREGQTIYSKIYLPSQSYRLDVPTDHLDTRGLRQPGVKYIRGDDPQVQARAMEFQKMAEEIFMGR